VALRVGVVHDLVSARATPEATALLDYAVRVVRPAEFARAIGGLVSGEGVGEGGTALRARVRGYSERVLEELADLAEVARVEDELFQTARLLAANPPLAAALQEWETLPEARRRLLADLFGGRVAATTLRLLSFAITAGLSRDLVGVYEWLADLAASERGRRIAQVRAAVELSDDERRRLAERLSLVVGREVEVRLVEDPSVIGGVLVSVGDLLIDGTVRTRFERLRESIAQWA
jgi:F-type H+-transporting ATPase subunit delta